MMPTNKLHMNSERFCKQEVNYHQYYFTKDLTSENDVLEYITPVIEKGFEFISYPVEISQQLKLLADYFFTTKKVENLFRLFYGYRILKIMKPAINRLYCTESVPPAQIAARILHSALYCYLEKIPEDVFVSIVAFYVSTRKDQKWSEQVLSNCHKKCKLTFKLWYSDEIWQYIDTYLFSKWWSYFADEY